MATNSNLRSQKELQYRETSRSSHASQKTLLKPLPNPPSSSSQNNTLAAKKVLQTDETENIYLDPNRKGKISQSTGLQTRCI